MNQPLLIEVFWPRTNVFEPQAFIVRRIKMWARKRKMHTTQIRGMTTPVSKHQLNYHP